MDADVVIFDMKKEWTVRSNDLATTCGWTPCEGVNVKGMPVCSLIRRQLALDDGEAVTETGQGAFVPRGGPAG